MDEAKKNRCNSTKITENLKQTMGRELLGQKAYDLLINDPASKDVESAIRGNAKK